MEVPMPETAAPYPLYPSLITLERLAQAAHTIGEAAFELQDELGRVINELADLDLAAEIDKLAAPLSAVEEL
jgi:hypothetical protein